MGRSSAAPHAETLRLVEGECEVAPKPQIKDPIITRKFLARVVTASVIFSGTFGAMLVGVGNHFAERGERKANETIQAVEELTDEARGLRTDVKDAKSDLGQDFEDVNTQATELNLRACSLLRSIQSDSAALQGCDELLAEQQAPPTTQKP